MIPLPVLAAGGAAVGWLVGRAAQGSETAGGDSGAPAPAPDATSSDPGTASLDWGQDLSGGGGMLPGASPVGDSGYDYNYDNGNNTSPTPVPPPSSTAPPPAPAPTGNTAALVSAYGPKPPGAVGVVDLHGVRLYRINAKGQATLVDSSSRVHAWVSSSKVYKGDTFSQATLRRVLSDVHLGAYCRVDDDHFTGAT